MRSASQPFPPRQHRWRAKAAALAALGLWGLPCPAFAGGSVGPRLGDSGGKLAQRFLHTAPADAVRPMIGTAGTGHVFPGAAYPFGLVALSPDTGTAGWEHCSGYRYADTRILGFSHTHLSGTGCSDLGDVLLMPLLGPVRVEPGDPRHPGSGYAAQFLHADEEAHPGYYRVLLRGVSHEGGAAPGAERAHGGELASRPGQGAAPSGPGLGRRRADAIAVELTATAHAGLHRYRYQASGPKHVIVDLAHGMQREVLDASLSCLDSTTLAGYRHTNGWAKDRRIYFVARFSRPFTSCQLYCDRHPALRVGSPGQQPALKVAAEEPREASGVAAPPLREVRGASLQAAVALDLPAGGEVLVKVGVSPTSIADARANLEREIPGFDFDGVVRRTRAQWNRELGAVHIETSDPALQETFYTALYHTMLAPQLSNNADRSYLGADHRKHQASFDYYSTFSLWDQFRAWHPLMTLIEPQRVDAFACSMLAWYEQAGQQALPVWPLWSHETWCMIGYHAVSVLAEAYAKGFRGFDARAAYAAMRATALHARNGQETFHERGYIPYPLLSDARLLRSLHLKPQVVSRSLEYAYDDWCIAQMARALGDTAEATRFERYAASYRCLVDKESGLMRPRRRDGSWLAPFDPKLLDWAAYTEADAWQYSFFVPHDPYGLSQALGGDAALVAGLDRLFAEDSAISQGIPDITGMVGQYCHGNEPCHHVPYLYSYAGAPYKTQARVRQLLTTMYSNQADGLCGNDDCGQMSAWYVLSAMGLYPVNPASGVYVLGSPLLAKATLHLNPRFASGRSFTVEARHNRPGHVYVQAATLNGHPLARSWISHAEITRGGRLVLDMGPRPQVQLWSSPDARPPLHL
jgi:predicted alpha-1,2-mannosidase